MSSLGKTAFVDQLVVRELGSASAPVQTIHRASTDLYENDLSFVESGTGDTRLKIKTDGHLQCQEDVEFFNGPINSATKKFSIGLDSSGENFTIRNEVSNEDVFVINADNSGSVASKQDQLKTAVGQVDISTDVLESFQLTSNSDGPDYATSLLTAKAMEDYLEGLKPYLVS